MRGRRRGTLIAVLETAQPRHFGPQDHDLAEDEEDADDQHAQNDGVERRRVHEHAHQVRQQENDDSRHRHQEEQHADEVGKRAAQRVVLRA